MKDEYVLNAEGEACIAKDFSSKRMKHRTVATAEKIAKIVWIEGFL